MCNILNEMHRASRMCTRRQRPVHVLVRPCHALKSASRVQQLPSQKPIQPLQNTNANLDVIADLNLAASLSHVTISTSPTGMRGLVSQDSISPGTIVLRIPWSNVLAVPKYQEVQQLWITRFLEPFEAAHGQLPVALERFLSTGKHGEEGVACRGCFNNHSL